METVVLYAAEYALVSLVWETEPVDLPDLVWSCFVRFGWKKSVTHSVLRSMCKRGILQKEGFVITSCVPENQVAKCESEALPVTTSHHSHSKFTAMLLRNSGIRKILNYKKPWFWLALGFVVSTVVCTGILALPYLENRIDASTLAMKAAAESSNEQLYVMAEDKFDALDKQLTDIVPPGNLYSNGNHAVWSEKGLAGICFDYAVYTYDDSKPQDIFDIVQKDLTCFAKNAAKVYSRIDQSYSIQYNIAGYDYTACVAYSNDPVTSELQEQISIQKNDTINNGNAAERTYYVEVASGETIAVVNGWG